MFKGRAKAILLKYIILCMPYDMEMFLSLQYMQMRIKIVLILVLCPILCRAQVRDVYPEAEKLCLESRWAEAVSLCLEGLSQDGISESAAVELYSVLGVSYARLNAFGKAAEYMKKCYEYDVANGESKGLTSSLINLASMYVYAGEPEKGEGYALEAVANEQGIGRPDYLAKAYGKACDVYHALKNDSLALYYADKAVEIAKKELDEVQVAVRQSQRAYALSGLERHKEALDVLRDAEKALIKADARQSLSVVYFQQAQEYGILDNLTREMECLQEAQVIASEIRDLPLLQKIAQYETERREQTVDMQNARLARERLIRIFLTLGVLLLLAAVATVAILAVKAHRSNTQKDFLLRVISHDMRSPAVAQLRGIQLFRQNMDKLSDEDFRQVISQMELQAGAEVELIENALKWAKYKSSADEFETVRFNLTDLAQETVTLYRQPADIKGITLEIIESADIFVNTNRTSVGLVIRNLLSNAIKFSKSGDKVTIEVGRTDTDATLSVSDQGIGIEETELTHIFDATQKVRRTGTAGEPTNGLGLAISKTLIEELGGSIDVSSQPSLGSTFTIHIPIA